MIEFDLGIAEQLTQVTTTSSVQVRVGTSNSDLVIASILQPLMQQFGMGGVYILSLIHISETTRRRGIS